MCNLRLASGAQWGGKGERDPAPKWGARRRLFASPPASPYCSGRKLPGSFGAWRIRPGSPPRKRRSASGLRLRPPRSERRPLELTKRARRRAAGAATAKRAKSRGCPSRRALQKTEPWSAGNPQRRPRAKSRENPTPSVAGKRAQPGRLGLEASLFMDLDCALPSWVYKLPFALRVANAK